MESPAVKKPAAIFSESFVFETGLDGPEPNTDTVSVQNVPSRRTLLAEKGEPIGSDLQLIADLM